MAWTNFPLCKPDDQEQGQGCWLLKCDIEAVHFISEECTGGYITVNLKCFVIIKIHLGA